MEIVKRVGYEIIAESSHLGVIKHMDMMRSQEKKEEQDNYTPYEHLRTVVENSDFYALEYKVDIERDILGKQ